MAKEFNTLLEQAETIRTEIEVGANTANRVGGTIKDIVETMKAHTGELNMSVLYPESGDSGKFTLKQAVEAVPADMRPVVRKLVFMDYSGDTQEYNFNGLFSDANFLDEDNWTKSGSASNFLNLGDIQNVETARKGINPKGRKLGLSVTYRIAQKWVNEQYVGTDMTDTEWVKNENWSRMATGDDLSVLEEDLSALEEGMPQEQHVDVDRDGFYIIDSDGNIAFGVEPDGTVLGGGEASGIELVKVNEF